MATRQTYVVGAFGLLVGMAMGATSGQNAEVVSFAGNNPNTTEIRMMDQLHRAAGYLRSRNGATDENGNAESHVTEPRRPTREEAMARRIQMLHSAMRQPLRILGVQRNESQRVEGCAQYTRTRYTRCLEALIRGDTFEANHYPTGDNQ